MSKYLVSGNTVRPQPEKLSKLLDNLPCDFYKVSHCNSHGFYLEFLEDEISNPKKIYGDKTKKRSERILETFGKLETNMGVLLSGLKGSGKTLLARQVCIDGNKSGIPVILIQDSFHGDDFKEFMRSISSRCIILIDEYDKLYSTRNDLDSEFLPILDGVFDSNKLFILTCNGTDGVSDYLIGRPSRIRYLYEYDDIDYDVMSEIVDDKIKFKQRSNEVKQFLNSIPNLSFDKVNVFIEEFNFSGEDCKAISKFLNMGQDININGWMDTSVYYKNLDISDFYHNRTYISFHDEMEERIFTYSSNKKQKLFKEKKIDKLTGYKTLDDLPEVSISIENLSFKESDFKEKIYVFYTNDFKIVFYKSISPKEFFKKYKTGEINDIGSN